MTGRILERPEDIEEGAQWLTALEPRFGVAWEAIGEIPLRRKPDGFGTLFFAIVGQQVSVASANAIWGRCVSAGFDDPERVAAASEADLRAAGLSGQKVRYAQALAFAGIDFDALRGMRDADVLDRLVAVTGIGPWTAEIYAMFALGRADVFAPGDLALQEGARMLFGLDARPKEKPFRFMAEAWSPWRAVAARLLWAYYAHEKKREAVF